MKDKKKAAIIRAITIGLILTCILGFIGYTKANTNSNAKADPFGHMYRVSEMMLSNESSPELDKMILVNLSSFHNLWIMEDITTYNFDNLGELKEIELDEDDTRKGLWSLTYDDNSLRYEITVEEDDSIVLSQLNAEQLCWSYKLSRVDMVSVNVSTFGKQEFLEIDWFFTDTFLYDLTQLSSGTIPRKGKIRFFVDDDSVEKITVIEEYYTDGNAEYTEYQLTKENGFSISAERKYDAGIQYAIYRIPYDIGEYVFYLKYT